MTWQLHRPYGRTAPAAPALTYTAELTDTFGGEANYSWVRRETFSVPVGASYRSVVIAAKKALGLTGCRCQTTHHGDLIELRPSGSLTVAFVTLESR
jgi:hypothetical protein